VITGEKINFLIGAGNHPWVEPNGAGSTCVNLEIDGKVVKTMTGANTETMARKEWDVSGFKYQLAVIRIIDENPGGWGHINCDDFNMLDAAGNEVPFKETSVSKRGKLAASWGAIKKLR